MSDNNNNLEAVAFTALYNLVVSLSNPELKRVHKYPPAIAGWATPAAYMWLMTSTGRAGPRADNARKWSCEISLMMAAPVTSNSSPEQVMGQLRSQFENALMTSNNLGVTGLTGVQTGQWLYKYDGTSDKAADVGIETVVTFTWINVPAGGN